MAAGCFSRTPATARGRARVVGREEVRQIAHAVWIGEQADEAAEVRLAPDVQNLGPLTAEPGVEFEVARCQRALWKIDVKARALMAKGTAMQERLAGLEDGTIVPPPYRPPARGDHVVAPPAGSLGTSSA